MEVRNKEKFKRFLEENIKDNIYVSFNAYLEDLEKQYCDTGMAEYEMSKFETKSGRPQIISYKILDIEKFIIEF